MATCALDVSGHISIGGTGCGCGDSAGGPGKYQPLDFGCTGAVFDKILSTDCPVRVEAAEQDMPATAGIDSVEFLFVKATAPVVVKHGGAAPKALSGSVTEPVTFAGGEAFVWRLMQGATVVYTVSVAFTAGAKTLAQIATAMNAAAVGAGLTTLPVSVEGGKLAISGPLGAYSVEVTTALGAIGFASTGVLASGEAQVSLTTDTMLFRAPRGLGLVGLRISGPADVLVVAAGS